MMVGRAFLEALKFGAAGGAVLGASLWVTLVRDGEFAPARENLIVIPVVLLLGAAIGLAIAYVALLFASMAADVAGRFVGVIVAFLVTFAWTITLWRIEDPTSWWLAAPITIALYGAAASWFRIPHILGR
jgi:hypothetical protein